MVSMELQLILITILLVDSIVRVVYMGKRVLKSKFLLYEIVTLSILESIYVIFQFSQDSLTLEIIHYMVFFRIPRFMYGLAYFKPF